MCAVLCVNTGLLCVSVCMGVLVALVWRSQSLREHRDVRHEHLTFKEGSGISNSVP